MSVVSFGACLLSLRTNRCDALRKCGRTREEHARTITRSEYNSRDRYRLDSRSLQLRIKRRQYLRAEFLKLHLHLQHLLPELLEALHGLLVRLAIAMRRV